MVLVFKGIGDFGELYSHPVSFINAHTGLRRLLDLGVDLVRFSA